MAALGRRLSWIPAAGALALLGYRVLWAAAGLGRELDGLEADRIERAFLEPLDRRIEKALVLPEGSLGAERDARTLGAKVRRLLLEETEPDAGVLVVLREEESAFRLYVMLSALLYPRVVVWVPEPSGVRMPAQVRHEPLYVLDLERGATWEPHGELVHSDADCELWRVEAP
jgi:hypothetical protein